MRDYSERKTDTWSPSSSGSTRVNLNLPTHTLLTRVDWDSEGEEVALISSEIIARFCERRGLTTDLYEPARMAKRSPVGIGEMLEPYGWRALCIYYDEDGKRKRKGFWNKTTLRALGVKTKTPYWREMRIAELRAVFVRWAMAEGVSEH